MNDAEPEELMGSDGGDGANGEGRGPVTVVGHGAELSGVVGAALPSVEVVGDFDEVGEGIAPLADAEVESGVVVFSVTDDAEGGEGVFGSARGEKVGSEGVGEEIGEGGAIERGIGIGFTLGGEPVG